MLFSEPVFLFFFLPVLLWAYLVCPRFLRNALLTVASLVFYTWGEKQYAVIMVSSIVFNYVIGLGVDGSQPARRRRVCLIVGVAGNLLLLGVFKYANFMVDNLNVLLGAVDVSQIRAGPVHLPIGISFFTFQSVSYVVDVYRGHARAQRNLLDAGLFVSLFPQLIAGPIVRYEQLAKQINHRVVTGRHFAIGVRRFIIGFGKKMIIANCVAWPADQIFALPADQLTTSLAWIGIVSYSLQIYFDFSGYSDMAIGLGSMFGFRIPENFNYPYVATSITEFWRRWHITLSRWFRDYLYIPLGGNRASGGRTYANLLIVFLLCGLWHGASWAFMLWGLYHGVFLVVERIGFGAVLKRTPRAAQHAYALMVVMIGWVVFRAATGPPARPDAVAYVMDYLIAMCGAALGDTSIRPIGEFVDTRTWLILVIGVIAATPAHRFVRVWVAKRAREAGVNRHGGLAMCGRTVHVAYLLGVLALGILTLSADTYNPFIYFQF